MNKRKLLISVLVASLTILTFSSAIAEEFSVFGKPLQLFGYATQGGAFSLIRSNKYDTENGLQSALMNLFVEGDYKIREDLKFYTAGMFTVDWAYQLKAGDNSWDDKLFSKSKPHLNVDDKYWQLLKEMRLTWSPGDFMFRAGKQIVSWGELLAFRIMDQINPLDGRRGFEDIEFETTIIPIWLFRADYYPKLKLSWLQDLGFEFVFNPNADFIPNQDLKVGNDAGGIWAPNVMIPGPFPFGEAHLGSTIDNIPKPEKWKEGQEFGFRVKANLFGALATINAFYGRDNSPVMKAVPAAPVITMASDGRLIIHPLQEGKYPLFRFVGVTVSKEITPLKASFLGDVAPVVYVEALYAYKSTFTFTNTITGLSTFDKSDEFRGGINVGWKVKIPLLNARTYFSIMPEFFYRRIINYPSFEEISGLKQDSYQTFLTVSTSYFHGKLNPSVTWIHDINSKSDYNILKLVYDHDYHWHFTLGAQLFHGNKANQGMELFDNKDQIFFKISYKWG
jgi:hypothetical protein